MTSLFYKIKVFVFFTFLFLFPVHIILIRAKNFLYDHNLIKAKKSKPIVISVGNISLGGAGKTPFTIALSSFLKKQGYSVGVAVRGHGRKNEKDSFLMKDQGWDIAGDETILLQNNLGTIPIYVSKNKFDAANHLYNEKNCEIVIMDDAFQHRKIYRDIDIVLVAKETAESKNKKLFPYGQLREPIINLKRADMIIETKSSESKKGGFVLNWGYKQSLLMPDGETCSLGVLKGYNNILSLCAIGSPKSFEKTLGFLKINYKKSLHYPDHYPFTKKDIDKLNVFIKKNNIDAIVCTEKDLIKLKEYKQMLKVPLGAIMLDYSLGQDIEGAVLIKIKEIV